MSLQSSWECLNMWTRKKKKIFLRTLILSATLHFILATKTWGQTESSQISFRDEENKHCQLHITLLMDSSITMKNSNTWMMKSEEMESPANRKNDLYFFLGNLHSPFVLQRYAHLVSSHTLEQTLNKSNERLCKAVYGFYIIILAWWRGIIWHVWDIFIIKYVVSFCVFS